jgi:hypothetical protein
MKEVANNSIISPKLKNKRSTTTKNGKKVNQYSLDGLLINTFNSVIEASEKTNISSSNIYNIVRNIRKTAGGFIWKYVEEEV